MEPFRRARDAKNSLLRNEPVGEGVGEGVADEDSYTAGDFCLDGGRPSIAWHFLGEECQQNGDAEFLQG